MSHALDTHILSLFIYIYIYIATQKQKPKKHGSLLVILFLGNGYLTFVVHSYINNVHNFIYDASIFFN